MGRGFALPAQTELWYLDRYANAGPACHIASAWRLSGALDIKALTVAVDAVVARHESLRTTFADRDGLPYLRVMPAQHNCLELTDVCRSVDRHDPLAAVQRLYAEPFDLSRGPLFRAAALRLSDSEYILLLSMHHIVADAWSLSLVESDLTEAYAAAVAGQRPDTRRSGSLAELVRRYQAERADPTWQASLDYWARELHGASRLTVPARRGSDRIVERPATAALSTEDFAAENLRRTFPADLQEHVRGFARTYRLTSAQVFLAGYAGVLARWANARDFVIAMPVANRARPDDDQVVAFLTNMAPIRVSLADDPTFGDLAVDMRSRCHAALAHQSVPLTEIMRHVREGGHDEATPLADIVFAHRRGVGDQLRLPGVAVAPFPVEVPFSLHSLAMLVDESGGTVSAQLEGRGLARAELEDLWERLVTSLSWALDNPRSPLSRLPVLLPNENWVVAGVGPGRAGTRHARPPELTVTAQVTSMALRSVGRTAITDRHGVMTYWQLLCAARGVAHHLRAAGHRRGDVVGVCVERGRHTISTMLGIFLAGCVYLPLDDRWPAARLRAILADSVTRAVLVSAGTQGLAGLEQVPSWSVDAQPAVPGGLAMRDDSVLDEPAYIMYTSGSTGRPKGVLVGHRGLANVVMDLARLTGLGPGQRMLASSITTFDISLVELLLPVTVGATVLVADDEQARDVGRLAELIDAHGIDIVQATPSVWAILDPPARRLRVALCTGEAMSAAVRDRLLTVAHQSANLYGPTEASIYATAWPVVPSGRVSVGHPLSNVRAWVLDDWRRPCPPGTVGTLVLGGVGVAEGYLGQPEQTAALFRADLAPVAGERTYLTGDLAHWSADGQLYVHGRTDDQVKVRGHRIELGEVEAAVRAVDGVVEVAVVVYTSHTGGRGLAAFVVPAGGVSVADAAAPDLAGRIRSALSAVLPEHLRPRFIATVTSLPRLPNGKLDRATLSRAVTADMLAGAATEANADAESSTRSGVPDDLADDLIAIWADVLGIDRVPTRANFFDLGGDSLSAAQIVARVSGRLGLRITMRDFLADPTIQAVAALVVARQSAGGGRIAS